MEGEEEGRSVGRMEGWRSPALRTPCSQQGRLGEVSHPAGGGRGDGGAGGAGSLLYGGSSSVLKIFLGKVKAGGGGGGARIIHQCLERAVS